jgi:dihydropteroate synthase
MKAPKQPKSTRCGNTHFVWGKRTYIMGILNITPDSFSGDGFYSQAGGTEAALEQAKRFVAEGADIIDIGGESTRPSSKLITANEELERVIPVLEKLSGRLAVPLSIDTSKSEVARRAVSAGAQMINDVWGLKHDPALAEVAATTGVPLVLTANERDREVKDIVSKVIADLKQSIKIARNAGVPNTNIIIDPGIGFGKTFTQNLELICRLAELKTLGYPILLGTSRKSVIGLVLNLPVNERLMGTAATNAIGITNGTDIIRVHDVAPMVQLAKMCDAVIRIEN